MAKHDEHLNILLDIQKQLGGVGGETARQSEMLKALNEKVAIQNGRVEKNEKKLDEHEAIINNWKGKLAIVIGIAIFVGGALREIIMNWLETKI